MVFVPLGGALPTPVKGSDELLVVAGPAVVFRLFGGRDTQTVAEMLRQ